MNKNIVDYLKGQNIKVIEEDIESKLDCWKQWYIGKVDGFHEYAIFNGKKKNKKRRKTLNMPALICHDWADLLLNERVCITVDDDYTQEKLNVLLKQVNFYVKGNNLIEYSYGIGGGFFVEFWDGTKTNEDYIGQDMAYPITFDTGRITEIAFASKKTIAGKEYTYLQTHLLDDNGFYVIDNVLLDTKGNRLKEVDAEFYEEHGIIPKWETGSKIPLFQMIRPNTANKERFDSAFGTSVFSNAIDAFKSCDAWYDAYYIEIILGKKRIFAKDSVTNYNIDKDTGEQIPVFDANDDVFYILPGDTEDGKAPIIESNMELRVAALDQALQTQLNVISQLCGFGANGYKWDNGSVSTATQIISENSKMFRTLKKHELVLNDAIVDMARGLLFVEQQFTGDKRIKTDASITVDFDDSIIEDTAEIKRQAMTELNMGLISTAEYFRRVNKLDKEQSEKFVAEMMEEKAKELELSPIVEEPEGA